MLQLTRTIAVPGSLPPASTGMLLPCAALTLLLAIGIRQTFGLFLAPMSFELGWGREVFAGAIALQNLVWGLGQPFAGAIADKYGSRRVLVAGGLSYAGGLLLTGYATDVVALGLSLGALVGLGLSGCAFGVVMGVVGRAFPPERRSVALSIAGAGGSVGQFVMLPFGQTMIDGYGWHAALLIVGGLAALIVPLSAGLAETRRDAESGRLGLASAMREACVHPGFWLLGFTFFVCGFQTVFIMTHFPAFLVDKGMTPAAGMTMLAVIGLANIGGSLALGHLGDRYSKKRLLGAIYALRTVALIGFLALPVSVASAAVFSVLFGVTFLGTVPVTNALLAQIFGVRFLSTLFGLAFLAHQVGAFFGAWLAGRMFDATGSYAPIWIGCVVLSAAAAVSCWPIDERSLPQTRPAA